MNFQVSIFVLVVTLFFSCGNAAAQENCDYDALLKKNIMLLDDYKFIKHFPIATSKQTEKATYTYLLNGGTRYRVVVVDNGKKGEKMMLNIRGRDKKIVASNKNKQKREFMNIVDFECPATGIYTFEAAFEDDRRDCGLNLLGYMK